MRDIYPYIKYFAKNEAIHKSLKKGQIFSRGRCDRTQRAPLVTPLAQKAKKGFSVIATLSFFHTSI